MDQRININPLQIASYLEKLIGNQTWFACSNHLILTQQDVSYTEIITYEVVWDPLVNTDTKGLVQDLIGEIANLYHQAFNHEYTYIDTSCPNLTIAHIVDNANDTNSPIYASIEVTETESAYQIIIHNYAIGD